MEASIELADEEYIDLTLRNRKERRELMDTDVEAYERLILSYNEEIENILSKVKKIINNLVF